MAKTALIFGHSTGLGAAITSRLAASDWNVVGVARSTHSGSGNITNVACDLSDEKQVHAVIETIRNDYAQFDALIYAAGTLTAHSIDQIDYAELEKAYRVNTMAAMVIESHLLDLIRSNESDVINITSSSIIDYYPQFSEYASSKAALIKFTSDLWKELRDTKCRVTDFCPSGFQSNMYNVMSGDKIDRDESKQMKAEDLAEIIGFFLALPKKIEIANVFINRK